MESTKEHCCLGSGSFESALKFMIKNQQHEQYLNLVDELLARGVSPDIAAQAARLGRVSRARLLAKLGVPEKFDEDFLPKLTMTGTAAEILQAVKTDPKFKRVSVTILSTVLRTFAEAGDPRVEILPQSPRCKKSLRFAVNN